MDSDSGSQGVEDAEGDDLALAYQGFFSIYNGSDCHRIEITQLETLSLLCRRFHTPDFWSQEVQFALVYFDDMIYSNNPEDHFRHVRIVLHLLTDAGVTLRLSKCSSFNSKVTDGHRSSPVSSRWMTRTPMLFGMREIQRIWQKSDHSSIHAKFTAAMSWVLLESSHF